MGCAHVSAGKTKGSGGKKIGNLHLRWAFAEAACLFLRQSERARRWKEKQDKKRGLTRPLFGGEPVALIGRPGGTDKLLGRGGLASSAVFAPGKGAGARP